MGHWLLVEESVDRELRTKELTIENLVYPSTLLLISRLKGFDN